MSSVLIGASILMMPGRGAARARRVGNFEQLLSETEMRIARVKDYEELENLQSAYGYYLDKNLWNDLADLFARDGRSEASLAFVASPLGRARCTMELVRDALNLRPEDYAIDDRLREIGYGTWEGSTLSEMQAAYPDAPEPLVLCSTLQGKQVQSNEHILC